MILPASKFTPITVLSFGSGELLVMAFKNSCCLVRIDDRLDCLDKRLDNGLDSLDKRLDNGLDNGLDKRLDCFDDRVLSILYKMSRK